MIDEIEKVLTAFENATAPFDEFNAAKERDKKRNPI
jgi:hypothetical protein